MELLVVMAIIGIISAIALPQYQQYTRETRRVAAQSALSDAQTRQEQFFLDNKTYTTTVGAGGLNMATTTDGGFYALSVTNPTGCVIASCFVLTATPQSVGNQTSDICGTLNLQSDGSKTPNECW